MATDDRSTVVGVFEDRALAQRAIDELRFAGFTDDQIGYAVRNETVEEGNSATGEVEHDTRENTTKGVVAGGIVGGALGAAAALLIPGIGPVLAGAAGGIIGALMSIGIPEEEAQRYQRHFDVGRIIVTVRTDGHQKEALDILRRNGALEANERFGQSVDPDFIASSRASYIDTRPQEPVADTSTDDSFFTEPSEPGTIDDPRMRGPRV